MNRTTFFLHGLESSSQGNKGRWFQRHFPEIIINDYSGSLDERMECLARHCRQYNQLVLIGSSFGGLMAVKYAFLHPQKCERLILLAPALNFTEYTVPEKKLNASTFLIIGKYDTVTPPSVVVPRAKKSFNNLQITLCDDDHTLSGVFQTLDWSMMLGH